MKSAKQFSERGISNVVAETLLISIAVLAMTSVAYVVVSNVATQTRYIDVDVRLENWGTHSIKITLFHMGGDTFNIPTGQFSEFKVMGGYIGEHSWENTVAWDNWVFDNDDGFEVGDNVVGYLNYDSASISLGQRIWISMLDFVSEELLFRETFTVENSLLYE